MPEPVIRTDAVPRRRLRLGSEKTTTIRLSDTDRERLHRLGEALHLMGTDVIRLAIRSLYDRTFPKRPVALFEVAIPAGVTPTCVHCGAPVGHPALMAVMPDGTTRGPLCATCANAA